MAYIATVPPIRFINLGSVVGGPSEPNRPDDVLIVRAFMIYVCNQRTDLPFTKTRLATLHGTADQPLAQMITDYKEFKRKAFVAFAADEWSNIRVSPQDERFALGPLRTTIMALNSDVRPLSGYGDTVIDVMCNLFPIRGMLTGTAVGPDTYWRDLARNRVPWGRWLRAQQENAANERSGANTRTATRKATEATSDEDNELFRLLHPYEADLKVFREHHTRTELTSTPNPSAAGQAVAYTAKVMTLGGQPAGGKVAIYSIDRTMLRVHGQMYVDRLKTTSLVPLMNGSATVTFNLQTPGRYKVKAEYPDTGSLVGSTTEIEQQVN